MRLTLRNAAMGVAGIAVALAAFGSERIEVLCMFFSGVVSIPLVLIASRWVAPGPGGSRSAFDTVGLIILYLLISAGLAIAMIIFAFNCWPEDAH